MELSFSLENCRKLRQCSYLELSKLIYIKVWMVVTCECVGTYIYMHVCIHVCMCVCESRRMTLNILGIS